MNDRKAQEVDVDTKKAEARLRRLLHHRRRLLDVLKASQVTFWCCFPLVCFVEQRESPVARNGVEKLRLVLEERSTYAAYRCV